MIILALDTTTRGGSVAVLENERVRALVLGNAARTHGERLPGEIAQALDEGRVTRADIDLLAVATGPGAFTGLRIGLAAMQGLAMTLLKPVVGVSALDALAEQGSDAGAALIVPWMDAQRGDVFASLVDATSGTALEAPTAAGPRVLLDAWAAHLAGRRALFIGDAVERDRAVIESGAGMQNEIRRPSALSPEIARIARQRAAAGESGSPHALEPIYVRRPDAEIERERRRQS